MCVSFNSFLLNKCYKSFIKIKIKNILKSCNGKKISSSSNTNNNKAFFFFFFFVLNVTYFLNFLKNFYFFSLSFYNWFKIVFFQSLTISYYSGREREKKVYYNNNIGLFSLSFNFDACKLTCFKFFIHSIFFFLKKKFFQLKN